VEIIGAVVAVARISGPTLVESEPLFGMDHED